VLASGRRIMQPKLVFSGDINSSLSVKEGICMEKPAYADEISKRSGIVICVRF